MTFLECLPSGWNVSLFHYRNHGYTVGKVLTAIEVRPTTTADLL